MLTLTQISFLCCENLHQFYHRRRREYQNHRARNKSRCKSCRILYQEKFDTLQLNSYKEFIHFGLTSQDINNTAIPLSIKEAVKAYYLPTFNDIVTKIKELATEWKDIPMLARTHGQPASPTRLGKEIQVFITRLEEQISFLKQIPNAAKFGGATGIFNAHQIAYPKIHWRAFGSSFVNDTLGLKHSFPPRK